MADLGDLRIGADFSDIEASGGGGRDAAIFLDERTIVRRRIAHKIELIDGVAALWGHEEQEEFIANGTDLRQVADRYAERWGPKDFSFVHSDVSGGTALYEYASEALHSGIGNFAHGDSNGGEGRFFVVIPLDTRFSKELVPIVSFPPSLSVPAGSALFSVAVLVGRPWVAEEGDLSG